MSEIQRAPRIPQPSWNGMDVDPPKDGRWLWGEWPQIGSGNRICPRIVAPMRWMSHQGFSAHWCMNGRITLGEDPTRWAEMIYPLGEDYEQIG